MTAFAQTVAPKFYADDPLLKAPAPLATRNIKSRKLSDLFDYFFNDFAKPGEAARGGKKDAPIRAQNVNTLGEVPDDEWYVGRHYFKPMTTTELVKGPNVTGAPASGKWKVVAAKNEGITPGFTILDGRGRRYVVKFDPLRYPEIATAPDVIVSKSFTRSAITYPKTISSRSSKAISKSAKIPSSPTRKVRNVR